MARPTKYCAKCGEYVAKKDTTTSGDRWTKKWVHIDADGNTIYRNHAAVLEGGPDDTRRSPTNRMP